MNRAITTAISSITIAQMLKVPFNLVNSDHLDWSHLLTAGGMPSSHSSGVTALATYVGLDKGWDSTEFAISTMLGLIVMYDAAGIRRHAGETAIQVNDLDEDVEKLAGHHPGIYHVRREKKLKERLGHQPIEVFAGALLGVGIGLVSYLTKPKSKKRFLISSLLN
ncbi:divergent PAP2 family protein [Caldalkalibacillus mannanilyticus]|uniref:divergent PAP2 family protein n=1 Tax=Caldalkalibacillus mannanilyticus TaxID=1418 RepID=UPI00046A4F5D|nr:divergent PAP2 family protein [Caldalkalibacillus mannanilyticus]